MSRRRHDSDEDLSPPRTHKSGSRRHDSPPARGGRRSPKSPPRKQSHRDPSPQRSPPTRTHGLQKTVKSNDLARKGTSGLTEEQLGKDAKTVFRDRETGRVRDLDSESRAKSKKDAEEDRIKSIKESKYQTWSKGLKQVEDEKEKLKEVVHEMEKPLARYLDDSDRDEFLKSKELDDDPMLAFMRKKKKEDKVKKASERGEVVFEKPRYKGPSGPPNRFAILPGYRWDGVDRSNGHEKKLFEKAADKTATKEEAYKWSTEDM